jgi:hypothetical protein
LKRLHRRATLANYLLSSEVRARDPAGRKRREAFCRVRRDVLADGVERRCGCCVDVDVELGEQVVAVAAGARDELRTQCGRQLRAR